MPRASCSFVWRVARFQRERLREDRATRDMVDDGPHHRRTVTFPEVRHQRGGKQVRSGTLWLCPDIEQTLGVRKIGTVACREQEPRLTRDAPTPLNRHRYTFVEPARQWSVASLSGERKMHDFVPDDRFQRVVRVGADTFREDRNITLAGRELATWTDYRGLDP